MTSKEISKHLADIEECLDKLRGLDYLSKVQRESFHLLLYEMNRGATNLEETVTARDPSPGMSSTIMSESSLNASAKEFKPVKAPQTTSVRSTKSLRRTMKFVPASRSADDTQFMTKRGSHVRSSSSTFIAYNETVNACPDAIGAITAVVMANTSTRPLRSVSPSEEQTDKWGKKVKNYVSIHTLKDGQIVGERAKPIDEDTSKGAKMMRVMGWVGQGLGVRAQGTCNIVSSVVKTSRAGLGATAEPAVPELKIDPNWGWTESTGDQIPVANGLRIDEVAAAEKVLVAHLRDERKRREAKGDPSPRVSRGSTTKRGSLIVKFIQEGTTGKVGHIKLTSKFGEGHLQESRTTHHRGDMIVEVIVGANIASKSGVDMLSDLERGDRIVLVDQNSKMVLARNQRTGKQGQVQIACCRMESGQAWTGDGTSIVDTSANGGSGRGHDRDEQIDSTGLRVPQDMRVPRVEVLATKVPRLTEKYGQPTTSASIWNQHDAVQESDTTNNGSARAPRNGWELREKQSTSNRQQATLSAPEVAKQEVTWKDLKPTDNAW